MPVTINDFTYTNNNSGRTRVNEQGLIVGVDFSLTSNTIGTGPRTFVLAADLGVNRDWPVGSTLVAVAQAGATGSMIGTVTSYDPATQALVMNVASITGSGTGTNWRIGSTMVRELNGVYDFRTYNPLTMQPAGLFEGGATNTVGDTRLSTNVLLGGLIRRLNTGIAPNGITEATELESGTNDIGIAAGSLRDFGDAATANTPVSNSIFVKVISLVGGAGILRLVRASRPEEFSFNLATLSGDYRANTASAANVREKALIVDAYPNGWYRVSAPGLVTSESGEQRLFFQTAIGSIIQVWCPQVESGSVCSSPIPANGVQVTRAADQLSVGGANFSQFYNSAQGTLVMELTPIAQAVGAVAGSLNDGTLNNAIRIQQKQSGTLSSIRKMATDGVTDVMAIAAAGKNILKSNGIDYSELDNGVVSLAALGVASSATGRFLTVGAGETFVEYSSSVDSFVSRSVASDAAFRGAHFGIGRFVIVGSSNRGGQHVTVSTDGLAFRRVNIPGLTQSLNEVTSNGTNQYVAVGNGGVIYTSPDTETWTARTSGATGNFTGVHYFSGRYVATNQANQTKYSDDGITWQNTNLNVNLIDVYHNGTNLWVAVGETGVIRNSSDGITWNIVTSPVTASLLGVHFADGLWVAVGNAGTVVTSPDGTTWTDRTATSGTVQSLNEVNFFGGRFYAVGGNQVVIDNTAANITANVTWVIRSTGLSSTLNGIATNGTRLLICGTSGAITTSDDGTTFTSRTGNAAQLNGAVFGNGTYVVVGNAINGSGLIATVNPTTFEYQRRVSNTVANINDVVFLQGAFYASINTSGTLARSTDGITWAVIQASGGQQPAPQSVAFGAGLYIAVGSSGRYLQSADGINFTGGAVTALGNASIYRSVAFSNGLFVAVGDTGSISTSPNGTTWTLRTSGVTSNLFSVMYSTRDNQWYAAGDNGTILRSADAITWTSIANDATVGIFTAGALQANPLAGKFIPNVKNRVAIGWTSTGGVSISINGGDVVTDPSVTMPVLTQYSVGMNGLSGQHWNSTIKTQRAYRVRVSDDELKALSRI